MKIDKFAKEVAEKIERFNVRNGKLAILDSGVVEYIDPDEKCLQRGISPLRHHYYVHLRIKGCESLGHNYWGCCYHECQYKNSITQDELDFDLKGSLRVSPEERYQHEKKQEYAHKLSYLEHTVVYDDPNYPHGKHVSVVKEYGCGRSWVDSKPLNEEGGRCVPECRFYPKYGRIEDSEIIENHNKRVERLKLENRIIPEPDLNNSEDYAEYLRQNPDIVAYHNSL